jgi:Raf kinase inhibitor-like YbhB/YbcL family protein
MLKPMAARTLLSLAGLIALTLPAQAMELHSPDLHDGAGVGLGQVYSRCGGANVSPALDWSGVPPNTKSLAITLIDMSVKPNGWSHWIVTDLPPTATSMARGETAMPPHANEVQTNFGDAHYDGPCPPEGSGVHHYRFTVWALKVSHPDIAPNQEAFAVAAALDKLALGRASLTGTYRQ